MCWVHLNNSVFLSRYSETKKNFADARATCASAPGGGDLVTIGTDSKQQFVRARMEIASVETMWLGVSLEKTDWRWVKSEYLFGYKPKHLS